MASGEPSSGWPKGGCSCVIGVLFTVIILTIVLGLSVLCTSSLLVYSMICKLDTEFVLIFIKFSSIFSVKIGSTINYNYMTKIIEKGLMHLDYVDINFDKSNAELVTTLYDIYNLMPPT